ncbi:MAG: hypothetical protein ABIZ34_09240, partial [Candidatus Limnocylindrales bacterium]
GGSRVSTITAPGDRPALDRRGLRLEYLTVGWNILGSRPMLPRRSFPSSAPGSPRGLGRR